MRRFGRLHGLTAVTLLSVASSASAQRREGSAETTTASVTLPTSRPGVVQLSDLGTNALPPGGEPATELGLIEQALPRLEASVIAQCTDRAHKSKWGTDNARFEKCVCPQVTKWLLPKVNDALRVQRALAKGKNGYSFTADESGRPRHCRVWAGVTAPNDDSVQWRSAAAQKPEKKSK
jgi:hypothetical protein